MTLDTSALEDAVLPITGLEGTYLVSPSSSSWLACCRRLGLSSP